MLSYQTEKQRVGSHLTFLFLKQCHFRQDKMSQWFTEITKKQYREKKNFGYTVAQTEKRSKSKKRPREGYINKYF